HPPARPARAGPRRGHRPAAAAGRERRTDRCRPRRVRGHAEGRPGRAGAGDGGPGVLRVLPLLRPLLRLVSVGAVQLRPVVVRRRPPLPSGAWRPPASSAAGGAPAVAARAGALQALALSGAGWPSPDPAAPGSP